MKKKKYKYTKEEMKVKQRIDSLLLYRRYQANNLLELVKHHKKTCEGETCTISLYAVKDAFEFYKCGKITPLELKNFL